MEITMIKKILHRIILGTLCFGCCLACASCSQESITPPVSATGNGQVKILYKIAGTSLSRGATEDGWGDEDNDGTDEWHENIINHIDLFVFNSNNKTLFKHIASSGNLNVDAKSEQTFTQNELTYNDVITGNYIYYMVANCEFDDNGIVEGVFTLDDLKEKLTSDLVFNQQQTSFAMDGMIENIPSPTDNTITLSFKLERAAAKIRLSVFSADGTTSIINDCQYQLYNYVEKGTSVLAQSEGYGEQGRESMSSLENANLVYDDSKVVFYSYPNDWFDENKVSEYVDEDGKRNGTWVIDDYVNSTPVLSEKETYILLKAPFEGKDYYYKVPVNYTIYKNNDAISFTDEELKEIHDLYRMKRNHIYNITVTIDREGGITEDKPVTLTNNIAWEVTDWVDRTVTVPDFD